MADVLEAGQADDVRVDGGGRRHAHGEVELLQVKMDDKNATWAL